MSDTPPTQRRYSDDGSHWWDGRAWQPVHPAEPDQPGPPPPRAQSRQPGPPPPRQMPPASTPQAPEPRRGVPLVAVILVVGVIALVAGQTVGSILAGRIASASVGGPPQVPAEFPHGRQRYFASVTVPQVTDDWLGNTESPWTCREETMDALLETQHELICEPADEAVSYLADVRVSYDGEDQVAKLSARCDRSLDPRDCSRHFLNLCDVVFSEDPSTAKKAKKWVRENMDSDRPAVFGRVHIWMPLEGASAQIHAEPVG